VTLRPALFLPAVVLFTLGCAGAPSEDVQDDDSAISAAQANERNQALKNHVLVAAPAGKKAQEKMGIKTWDVFAGTDAKSGFTGSVFYASDANGDAVYAFAADTKTKQLMVVHLGRDGSALDKQRLDADSYSLLLSDVSELRDRISGKAPSSSSSSSQDVSKDASRCSKDLAAAALTMVVIAGAPFLAIAAMQTGIGEALIESLIVKFLVVGGAGVAADVAFVAYASSVALAAADVPEACFGH
jgi:hypothetical protein